MALVKVPGMLRPLVGGERVVKTPGDTLREVLRNVEVAHPAFAGQVLDPQGVLRSYVNIYVNDEDVRYLQGLDTQVLDGDSVSVLPAVAGGE